MDPQGPEWPQRLLHHGRIQARLSLAHNELFTTLGLGCHTKHVYIVEIEAAAGLRLEFV